MLFISIETYFGELMPLEREMRVDRHQDTKIKHTRCNLNNLKFWSNYEELPEYESSQRLVFSARGPTSIKMSIVSKIRILLYK